MVSPFPGGEGLGVRADHPTSKSAKPVQRLNPRNPLCWTGATACLALILLTGYGRIHAGAHWPSDVLGGWLCGTLLAIVTVRITRLVMRRGDPIDDGRA